jgi:hypothetical protein
LQVAPPSPRPPVQVAQQIYYQPQAHQSQPILVQEPQAMLPIREAQSVPHQAQEILQTEFMPTASLTKVEGCLEAAMGDYSSTHPKWWPYRHIKGQFIAYTILLSRQSQLMLIPFAQQSDLIPMASRSKTS